MFDQKSDYSLNKQDPDSIVCKSSTGVHIRLTRLDFASPEEFEKWKHWSDEDYHDTEKADHVYSNHTVSSDKLVEVSITVLSPEEELMEVFSRQEQEELYRRLETGLETRLTPAQRRRLWMYCVEGMTVEEIAGMEQKRHQSISECLQTAKEKIKKFFEKHPAKSS